MEKQLRLVEFPSRREVLDQRVVVVRAMNTLKISSKISSSARQIPKTQEDIIRKRRVRRDKPRSARSYAPSLSSKSAVMTASASYELYPAKVRR